MPESGFEGRLLARWYSAAPPPLWLRPLALLYGGLLGLRGRLYRSGLLHSIRAPVPVVVVGNLTVGGTGKSPLTVWLAQSLAARGRRPGIASRGYGRVPRDVRLVGAGDTPLTVGDEPLMMHLAAGVPVCVAPRRSAAARKLITAGCDIILCDDGLQHLALRRDFEVAVVDGARGLGNGWLLPAGPLREPADRLAAVDVVVINGEPGVALPTATAPTLRMRMEPQALRAVAGDGHCDLAWLQGRAVHAVTGIGNPERFFSLLRSLGARVEAHALPDHHRFTAGDIDWPDALPVIMTAKDAVKCVGFAKERHWYLPVTAVLARDDEQWLLERILALGQDGGRLRD